jgi:hypothetical protein
MITALIAAMNPPRAQPKMTTIVRSSRSLQPPHISKAIIPTAIRPQNIPAAPASQP